MPLDSTEFLLHTLNVALDNLRERMLLESKRREPSSHYHYVVNYKCNTEGCAGVDPIISTYACLQSELKSIDENFSGHILFARHIP